MLLLVPRRTENQMSDVIAQVDRITYSPIPLDSIDRDAWQVSHPRTVPHDSLSCCYTVEAATGT